VVEDSVMAGLLASAATTFGRTANVPFDPGIALSVPQCEGMNVCSNTSIGRNDVYGHGERPLMASHIALGENDVMAGLLASAVTTFGRTANVPFDPGMHCLIVTAL